jgi:predicted RNA-binding protein YlxR (DUF448 family)
MARTRPRNRRPITPEPSFHPDQSDDDADQPEAGPIRRCIVTRERQPKEAMIRFVVGPDRAIVPDLAARLPGRGIWLSARGDVLETARTRGGFARAARAPVSVPADLAELVRAGLMRRIIEHLGLARRAGQAVGGFGKAREWVQAGRAGLVVQASDGSPEERARLLGGRDVPVVAPLPAADLGSAFGRDHVVHVAVLPGRLAEAIRIEAGRLAGVDGRAANERAGA